MSAEDNKRVARAFIEALQSGERDRIAGFLADDFIWVQAQDPAYTPQGGTHDRDFFLKQHDGFGDLMPGGVRLEVKGITAEGDRVAIEAESFGDSIVGLYNNRYHFLFEFRNGKLVVGKEYADSAYMRAFSERARAHVAKASAATH